MPKKFYLKSYVKKKVDEAWIIIHTTMEDIYLKKLSINEVDSFKKDYKCIAPPKTGKSDVPYPRYAHKTDKEILEYFQKFFEI